MICDSGFFEILGQNPRYLIYKLSSQTFQFSIFLIDFIKFLYNCYMAIYDGKIYVDQF